MVRQRMRRRATFVRWSQYMSFFGEYTFKPEDVGQCHGQPYYACRIRTSNHGRTAVKTKLPVVSMGGGTVGVLRSVLVPSNINVMQNSGPRAVGNSAVPIGRLVSVRE